MTAPHAPVTSAPSAPAGRPAPGWPFWLAFGILTPALLVTVLFTSVVAAGAGVAAADQHKFVGHSVVVAGVFADRESSGGLPQVTSVYTVTLPFDAPGALANTVQLVPGPTNFGFPPSIDFPKTLDFLIGYDGDRVVVGDSGALGTVAEVTVKTVRSADDLLATQRGWKVFWTAATILMVTVLPTLGILFGVRRRRAGCTRTVV